MSTNENGNGAETGSSGDLAVIGEGTPNEAKISLQVLQGIYHELTGKTEDVSKSFDHAFKVQLGDFEQLNHRVTQCCEQYHIKAMNCSVKTFYINDTQDTFSSFERFTAFNAGSTSAIESVLVTYNFLIVVPKVEKPQSYSLSVRLASRCAVESQMRESMPFRMPKIFRTMGGRTGVVNVKYIDYSVARSLLNTVELWFDSLECTETSTFWKAITKRSHFIPLFTRYFAGTLIAFLIFTSVDMFIPADASLEQLAKFLLLAFVGLFAAYKLAHHLGTAAENSLDSWAPLSYISLTTGDKNLIRKADAENKKSIMLALGKFIVSLMVTLIAKVIIDNLVK